MTRIVWDKTGERHYRSGVSNGVLYVLDPKTNKYSDGVPWNGLTSVAQKPEGGEPTALYADNIKYGAIISAQKMKGSIEAYTFPDEFAACMGEIEAGVGGSISGQSRATFALCYREEIGNDVNPNAGYEINIIYGCVASPSESSSATISDSPEAKTFSWEFEASEVPVTKIPDAKPTATFKVSSLKTPSAKMKAVEDKLYGTDSPAGKPTLLTPDEIIDILKASAPGG